jgi:peroxiredoxin
MNPTLLGYGAAAIVAVTGAIWLWLMQTVRIPKDRRAFIVSSVVSAALGAAALASGPPLAAGIAAAIATASSVLFLILCAMSAQAATTPAVSLGKPIIPFIALDDDDRAFDIDSLRGRPFLLKFFRGHWCPYCVAELRRWNELAPELDARGIVIVAICADLPGRIRNGRGKHGLDAVMLSDPDLAITDLYNLRNPRSLAPKPGVVIPLPIPTTILVDANGIVRWIDQAQDYMQRSDPPRVLAASRNVLGAPEAAPIVRSRAEPPIAPRSAPPICSRTDAAEAAAGR